MSHTGEVALDQLRNLFLFEDLTDDQLRWVREHSDVVDVPAGKTVRTEGAPAERFYVLLSGSLVMTRLVGGDPVEIVRADQKGVYCGATQFYLGDQVDQRYGTTCQAVADSRFLAVRAAEFAEAFGAWFPMAVHLLQGMFVGLGNTSAVIGQRERLLALGKLTAGLTHELNNPAALRERSTAMRQKLALVAADALPGEQMTALVGCQERFVERVRAAPDLTPLETADAEDEISDWLDAHDVRQAWELAPVFAAAAVTVAALDEVADVVAPQSLEGALRWLFYSLDTEALLNEIADSTARISALLDAAKQYSQLDRAPRQWFDVHEGLKATLAMLAPNLTNIQVHKQLDATMPRIPGHPAELNQVWTNLIDNAAHAMAGQGTLTIRTRHDGDSAIIEIRDTGSGIPPETQARIFEPFFTTKPVGQGTGLGLDVSYRVIVNRHHGDLRVASRPGNTVFTVHLPLTETLTRGPTPGGDR